MSAPTTVEGIDATTLVGSVGATQVDTGRANKDAVGAGNTLLGTYVQHTIARVDVVFTRSAGFEPTTTAAELLNCTPTLYSLYSP